MPTNWSDGVQVASVRCRPPSKLALASRLTPSMPRPICVLGLHAIFRFGEGWGQDVKLCPIGLSIYKRLDGVRNNCWRMFPSLLERPAIGYFQCNQQWFLEKDIVDTWSRQHHIRLVLNGDTSEQRLFQRFPRTTKALPVCHHSEGFPFSTMPLVIPKETFWKNWD